jgi:hypothetical protein
MLLLEERVDVEPLQLKGLRYQGLALSLHELEHVLAQLSAVTPLMMSPAPESRQASSWNMPTLHESLAMPKPRQLYGRVEGSLSLIQPFARVPLRTREWWPWGCRSYENNTATPVV